MTENILEANSSKYDFCSHPDCSMKNQHTMCVAAGKQSPRLYASGMTGWMRYQILLLHNKHRDNIAMGLDPGQPSASNMRKMYWDYELEKMAEVWARQCQKRHDECRNTIRFNVLQNMDVRPVLPRVTEAQLLDDAVGSWFSGSRVLPPEYVWSFRRSNCSASGGCNAHWYTTAAWGSTWRLGCSQALCTARRRSCATYRKKRRSQVEIDNSTEADVDVTRTSTKENILRRTKYMTTEEVSRLVDFEMKSTPVMVESPLHRGMLENARKKNVRKELKIIAYTFCNYGPAGNVEGFPIYEAGQTCKNCPQGTKCTDRTHRALCSVEGDPDARK
ncbi:venom allergen 3 homolog [Amyelois transitella]|uniref:venom allergen 3 homolog n=1 Tax=Amyelois transitella TaxID=680683 RepID=UPI0029903CF5|nr:venom allergen 3 homolog [Amyelois transitella]